MGKSYPQKKNVTGDADLSELVSKQGSSNAWKGITSSVEILHKGSRADVRNGKFTLFWRDKWLSGTSLMFQTTQEIPLSVSFKPVKDYWTLGEG